MGAAPIPQKSLRLATLGLLDMYQRINYRTNKIIRLSPEEFKEKLKKWGWIPKRLRDIHGCECRGTFGSVWKTNSPWKVVKYQQLSENTNRTAFADQEHVLLCELSRQCAPHIVRQFEAISKKEGRAFASLLEYAGETINNLYIRSVIPKQPSIQDMERIAKQILEGVNWLHSKGILHADLKPENIAEICKQIRILDLGISRVLGGGFSRDLLFSRFYRPPETVLFKKTSFPGDMWSVGCILFELATRTFLIPVNSTQNQLQDDINMLWAYIMRLGMRKIPLKVHDNFPELFTGSPPKAKPKPPTIKKLEDYRTVLEKALANTPVKDQKKKEQLIDLIGKMLQFDPAERISALEALNHPFFCENPTDICFSLQSVEETIKTVMVQKSSGESVLHIPDIRMNHCYHVQKSDAPYSFRMVFTGDEMEYAASVLLFDKMRLIFKKILPPFETGINEEKK